MNKDKSTSQQMQTTDEFNKCHANYLGQGLILPNDCEDFSLVIGKNNESRIAHRVLSH